MASPPVLMLAPGDRLSNSRTRRLATLSTIPASRIVMNVAYWPRFLSTSMTRSLPAWPRSRRVIRVSRLRRASRNRAVNGMKPKLGIDPSRSSQPRWPMKYARFGLAPVRLNAKSTRKITQTALSYRVSRSCSAWVIGRNSSTMIASEKIVRTRMKML